MPRHTPITRDTAETLALRALAHIASDERTLQRLLALTGMRAEDVRARASDPAFLAGVLDFLLGNEADLLSFCQAIDVEPTLPARARRLLPGKMGE
ncbi:MAG TPA: DUF3572 domain-containing protein [Candidatus Cybelea sp.]|nr:DUF3572 domain-containing protein [Candidatus Cybelea sp.]